MRHILLALAMLACTSTTVEPPVSDPSATRSYRMGFSAFPPAPVIARAVANLSMWTARADAAIIHVEPPWAAMLSGEPLADIARREFEWQVAQFRARGMDVVVIIDATNGVDRTSESDALVTAGRSITEPAVQALYREWARTLVAQIKPVALGLAAETNLIRLAAPARVYSALVQMTNATAAAVRADAPALPLFITIQVETAWGRLQGGTTFIGVEQDFRDFPFTQMIGLSSYPYLGGFQEPAEMPDDWYTRPLAGRTLPSLITEGGWTSANVAATATLRAITSSPEKQARWFARQMQLADRLAPRYLFQLQFSDIDLAAFNLVDDPRLLPFARLGLVDMALTPRPALAVWDAAFARRYAP
ncbi:MAG: hypothetical protein IT355_02565 [Gemmatimonadaceae bacterium]|nr:hypothetical protein [Gemmatimonadaceae bacterium]